MDYHCCCSLSEQISMIGNLDSSTTYLKIHYLQLEFSMQDQDTGMEDSPNQTFRSPPSKDMSNMSFGI